MKFFEAFKYFDGSFFLEHIMTTHANSVGIKLNYSKESYDQLSKIKEHITNHPYSYLNEEKTKQHIIRHMFKPTLLIILLFTILPTLRKDAFMNSHTISEKIKNQKKLAENLIPATSALDACIKDLHISEEEHEKLLECYQNQMQAIAAQGFLSGFNIGKDYVRTEHIKNHSHNE